jgi:hypothetical protein
MAEKVISKRCITIKHVEKTNMHTSFDHFFSFLDVVAVE